jgi:hypothetical protein
VPPEKIAQWAAVNKSTSNSEVNLAAFVQSNSSASSEYHREEPSTTSNFEGLDSLGNINTANSTISPYNFGQPSHNDQQTHTDQCLPVSVSDPVSQIQQPASSFETIWTTSYPPIDNSETIWTSPYPPNNNFETIWDNSFQTPTSFDLPWEPPLPSTQ